MFEYILFDTTESNGDPDLIDWEVTIAPFDLLKDHCTRFIFCFRRLNRPDTGDLTRFTCCESLDRDQVFTRIPTELLKSFCVPIIDGVE